MAASSRRRGAALAAALVALATLAVALRFQDARLWWLDRQSIDTLQRDAGLVTNDAPLRFVLARRLDAAGRYDEAIDLWRAAIAAVPPTASGPLSRKALAGGGLALARAAAGDEVVAALQRAAVLDSLDPLVYLGFAWAHTHRRQFAEAEKQLEAVNRIAPDNAEGWLLLGKVKNAQRRSADAAAPLGRAARLAPQLPAVWMELGNAFAFQARYGQAVEPFRTALALEPDNPDIRRALGTALGMSARTRSQYDEARAMMEEALAAQPDNEMIDYTLGQLHLRFNDLDGAPERLKRATIRRPDNAEAWYNLSVVEQRLGAKGPADTAMARFTALNRIQSERAVAEQRVKAAPPDAQRRLELSRVYRRTGNVVGAWWQAQISLRLAPENAECRRELAAVTPAYERHQKEHGGASGNPQEIGPPPPDGMVR